MIQSLNKLMFNQTIKLFNLTNSVRVYFTTQKLLQNFIPCHHPNKIRDKCINYLNCQLKRKYCQKKKKKRVKKKTMRCEIKKVWPQRFINIMISWVHIFFFRDLNNLQLITVEKKNAKKQKIKEISCTSISKNKLKLR